MRDEASSKLLKQLFDEIQSMSELMADMSMTGADPQNTLWMGTSIGRVGAIADALKASLPNEEEAA